MGDDNLEQKEAGILAVPEEKAGGAEELEEAGGKALVVKEVKEESAKRLSIIFVDETLNLSEEDLASVKECWTRLDLAESKNPPQAPTPPPSTPDGEPEVDPLPVLGPLSRGRFMELSSATHCGRWCGMQCRPLATGGEKAAGGEEALGGDAAVPAGGRAGCAEKGG